MHRSSTGLSATGRRMRILVVHEVEFVDKVVFEWQEFPEMLMRAGYEVAVVDYDSSSSWSDLLKWGFGPKRLSVACRLEQTQRLNLFRMIGPPPRWARRLFAAAASWIVMRRVFQKFRPDVVLLYAVPTCGVAVTTVARRMGIPVVFRSIDVLSQLVPRSIAFGVHILEKKVYASCERILVANPRLGVYVRAMSRQPTRTDLLLSPVDTGRFTFQAASREHTLARLGIQTDARVVVFVGSLFSFVGLDAVLTNWARIRFEVPNAHLLVVGGGPDEERLRRARSINPECSSVTFTGMRPYDEIPALISVGALGICPFEVNPTTRDVNPIKIMQYLACSVPCVSSPLAGTMEVLPEVESGVVYAEPGEAFADAIISLLSDSTECSRLGDAGRRWVARRHSFPSLVSELGHSLEEVAADSSRLD